MSNSARSRTRSAARLAAVQALYQQEMEDMPVARLLKEFHDHRLGATIEDAQYVDAEREFFDDIVTGVGARCAEIDAAISARLADGWTLARLDRPMRAILRAGAYELLARRDVPVGSVISEYVDVAHAFYDKRESGFVNGLLDAIAKQARAPREGTLGRPGELMTEAEAIERLRKFATDPAARGLADDAALFEGLVITHDSIAEGVHFLPDDPAGSVGWKLVTVNLSDLAGKGATPAAAVLSLTISSDSIWDEAFLSGVEAACTSYRLPLIGGDTIALPDGAPRVFGLTAIGRAGPRTPARSGGKPGDRLWVVGTIGDSAAGLALLKQDRKAAGLLVDSYRQPIPQLAAGQALALHATAMMDVSDGLLLDAARLAQVSGCSATIDLAALPLSAAFVAERGGDLEARLFAATGGDDYALLAALPPELDPLTLSLPSRTSIRCIGTLGTHGHLLSVVNAGSPVVLPEILGHEHRGNSASPVAGRA